MTKGQIRRVDQGDLRRRAEQLESDGATESFEGEYSFLLREIEDRITRSGFDMSTVSFATGSRGAQLRKKS